MGELFLARHGETEWSASGRHTGRTDIALTERGRAEASTLAGLLAGRSFALVLTSPSQRAVETCELAGLEDRAQIRDDLREWDYGDYEGLTTPEILERRPDWSLWRDGGPNGEAAADVGAPGRPRDRRGPRRRRRRDRLRPRPHAARPRRPVGRACRPTTALCSQLATGTLSTLGYEHGTPSIASWSRAAGRLLDQPHAE